MKTIYIILLFVCVAFFKLTPQPPVIPCPVHLVPLAVEVDITPPQSAYCIGDNFSAFYMNPQGHGIVDLSWVYSEAGSVHTQQLNSPSTLFNVNGVSNNGQLDFSGIIQTIQVGNCSFQISIPIHVTVDLKANAGPDKFVSTNFPTASIGAYPSAFGGQAPYTYQWSPNTNISSLSAANPVVNPSALLTTYQLVVVDGNNCVSNPDQVNVYNISGLSATNQTHYAVLKKDLDGTFYETVINGGANNLYFLFYEEYYKNNSSLTYRILDSDNVLITTLPTLVKQIGDNRFSLNVLNTIPSLSQGEYYTLFAENEKGEIWQARFIVK